MCVCCALGAGHAADAVPGTERSDESTSRHRAPASCQADHALRLRAQGSQEQTCQGRSSHSHLISSYSISCELN